jgi:hypothetical protein
MEPSHHDPDAQSTAAAVTLLFNLRLRYSGEMPLAAWRLLANAETRLNHELDAYLRSQSLEQGRPADCNVDTPTVMSIAR